MVLLASDPCIVSGPPRVQPKRALGDPWAMPQFPLQQSLYMEGVARGFFFISVFCSPMAWGRESRESHMWL